MNKIKPINTIHNDLIFWGIDNPNLGTERTVGLLPCMLLAPGKNNISQDFSIKIQYEKYANYDGDTRILGDLTFISTSGEKQSFNFIDSQLQNPAEGGSNENEDYFILHVKNNTKILSQEELKKSHITWEKEDGNIEKDNLYLNNNGSSEPINDYIDIEISILYDKDHNPRIEELAIRENQLDLVSDLHREFVDYVHQAPEDYAGKFGILLQDISIFEHDNIDMIFDNLHDNNKPENNIAIIHFSGSGL